VTIVDESWNFAKFKIAAYASRIGLNSYFSTDKSLQFLCTVRIGMHRVFNIKLQYGYGGYTRINFKLGK